MKPRHIVQYGNPTDIKPRYFRGVESAIKFVVGEIDKLEHRGQAEVSVLEGDTDTQVQLVYSVPNLDWTATINLWKEGVDI